MDRAAVLIDPGDLVDLADVVEGVAELALDKRRRDWRRWAALAIGLTLLAGVTVLMIALD